MVWSFKFHSLLMCVYTLWTGYSIGTIDYTALKGTTASLKCHVDNQELVHTVVWKKNAEIILSLGSEKQSVTNGNFHARMVNSNFCELLISNLSFQDAGTFTCVVFFISETPQREEFFLQVQGQPRLNNSQLNFEEGDLIKTECCVDITLKTKVPEVSWAIEDGTENIPLLIEKYETSSTEDVTKVCSRISFLSSRRYHKKALSCLVNNQNNLTDSIILNIFYAASVEIFVSGSRSDRKIAIVKEHDDVIIICISDANPPANVTLVKQLDADWEPVLLKPSKSSQNDTVVTNLFEFLNVSAEFEGFFRCKGGNYIGETAGTKIFVEVIYKPKTTITPDSEIDIELNGEFKIDCRVDANGVPEIKLQKFVNNELWLTLPKVPSLLHRKGKLSEWRFSYADVDETIAGSYRCIVTNGIGMSSTTQEVIVTVRNKAVTTQENFPRGPDKDFRGVLYFLFFFVFFVALAVSLLLRHLWNRARASPTAFQESSRKKCIKFSDGAVYSCPDVVSRSCLLESGRINSTLGPLPERPMTGEKDKNMKVGEETTSTENKSDQLGSLQSSSSKTQTIQCDSSGYASFN